jgi:hypothetical protein
LEGIANVTNEVVVKAASLRRADEMEVLLRLVLGGFHENEPMVQ